MLLSKRQRRATLAPMPQSPHDPVAWMLDNAPLDEEPETDAERRAVALAHANRARGIEPAPLDEVLREFDPALDTPTAKAMTAKEKLRVQVEELTEQEAEAMLDFIASRGCDGFTRWLDSRPEDDEPLTAEEQAALAESDADIAAGRTVSFEEIKREFGYPAG
jgi:hypothetical protein